MQWCLVTCLLTCWAEQDTACLAISVFVFISPWCLTKRLGKQTLYLKLIVHVNSVIERCQTLKKGGKCNHDPSKPNKRFFELSMSELSRELSSLCLHSISGQGRTWSNDDVGLCSISSVFKSNSKKSTVFYFVRSPNKIDPYSCVQFFSSIKFGDILYLCIWS